MSQEGRVASAGATIALLGLLGWRWHRIGRMQRARASARPGNLPEPLQVWEGEGGQSPMAEVAPAAASPDEARTTPTTID